MNPFYELNNDKVTSNTIINKHLKQELRKIVACVKVTIPDNILDKHKTLDRTHKETVLEKLLKHDINYIQRYEFDYLEYRVYELILAKRLYLEGIKFNVLKRQQKENIDVILFIWNHSEYILDLLDIIKSTGFPKVSTENRCTHPKDIYKIYLENEFQIIDRINDGERIVDVLHDIGVPYVGREWTKFMHYIKNNDY